MALPSVVHRVRRFALRLVRWRTRGVKVMVFDRGGRLLLVRHGYGVIRHWMLPGGGVHRGEAPPDAARREVREEVGCTLDRVEPMATFEARAEGRRDTVHLFRATTDSVPVPDGREVIEARFFALDALPADVSPATLRRIAELATGAAADRW